MIQNNLMSKLIFVLKISTIKIFLFNTFFNIYYKGLILYRLCNAYMYYKKHIIFNVTKNIL